MLLNITLYCYYQLLLLPIFIVIPTSTLGNEIVFNLCFLVFHYSQIEFINRSVKLININLIKLNSKVNKTYGGHCE